MEQKHLEGDKRQTSNDVQVRQWLHVEHKYTFRTDAILEMAVS